MRISETSVNHICNTWAFRITVIHSDMQVFGQLMEIHQWQVGNDYFHQLGYSDQTSRDYAFHSFQYRAAWITTRFTDVIILSGISYSYLTWRKLARLFLLFGYRFCVVYLLPTFVMTLYCNQVFCISISWVYTANCVSLYISFL